MISCTKNRQNCNEVWICPRANIPLARRSPTEQYSSGPRFFKTKQRNNYNEPSPDEIQASSRYLQWPPGEFTNGGTSALRLLIRFQYTHYKLVRPAILFKSYDGHIRFVPNIFSRSSRFGYEDNGCTNSN